MTPTQQQISTAILWLEANEGEGEERLACMAVADWLEHLAYNTMLRDKARMAGISVVELRRILRLRERNRPLWPPGRELTAQVADKIMSK